MRSTSSPPTIRCRSYFNWRTMPLWRHRRIRSILRTGRGARSVAALVASVLAASVVLAQPGDSYWYTLRGATETPLVESVAAFVGVRTLNLRPQTRTLSPQDVYADLRRRGPSDTIFVAGSLAGSQMILRLDQGHDVLARLGLEPVNVRIAGHPFYLF